jgi:hypothetical protein
VSAAFVALTDIEAVPPPTAEEYLEAEP